MTIGLRTDGSATESDAFNSAAQAGGYVRSRVEAENLALPLRTERGLPAVAMCVSNTYRRPVIADRRDGMFVAAAAGGKMPFYIARVQVYAAKCRQWDGTRGGRRRFATR